MKSGIINNEIKNKEQLIRELKVTRAQLAVEIERKTAQIETTDKLIANLRNELNITTQKLRAQFIKRKELNDSLEVCRAKHKRLSESIKDLPGSNILDISKKIKHELRQIDWFREINLLKLEFAS